MRGERIRKKNQRAGGISLECGGYGQGYGGRYRKEKR